MRKGCSIAVIILILVLIGAHVSIRMLINHNLKTKLGPEQYAAQERLLRETWVFPQEWSRIEQPSQEYLDLKAETKNLFEDLEVFSFNTGIYLDKVYSGSAWTESEQSEIENKLNDFTPAIEALIRLVGQPEYKVEMDSSQIPGQAMSSTLMLQLGAKLLCLQAQIYTQQGEWQKAYEMNLAAHGLAKHHPVCPLINKLIAIAIQSIAAKSMDTTTAHCSDAAAMHNALNEMNALAPMVIHRNSVDQQDPAEMSKIEVIAMLREAKMEGYEIDLSPGKPGKFYIIENIEYQMEKNAEIARQMAQANPQMPQPPDSRNHLTFARMLGFEWPTLMMMSAIAAPNFLNAQIRERCAIAQFDLNRLNLATRIEELETGQKPTDQAAIISKYFPEPLEDAHTLEDQKAPYRFDTAKGVFYSIGPNGADNSNSIQYDPSNGITSAGDIAPWTGK